MRRFLRYLRIAFSATCLIACVLLIALWVRSYLWLDALKAKPPDLQLSATSLKGKLVFEQAAAPWHNWDAVQPWQLISEEVNERTYLSAQTIDPQYSRLNILFTHVQVMQASFFTKAPGDYSYLVVPHYYPVALAALVAGIPWVPWSFRFGLRTLLISTTLIAGVLGLYVYLRAPAAESRGESRAVRSKMVEAPIDYQTPESTTPAFLRSPTAGTLSGGLNP